MFEFIKSILGLSKTIERPPRVDKVRDNKDDQQHDIIDYDGMGNQGRFPTSKNKKRRGRK